MSRIPFVVDYHPGLPDIQAIFKKHQSILQQSDRLKDVVNTLPILSFRRPKNLKDNLVRAKVCTSQDEKVEARLSSTCGKPRCQLCEIISLDNTIVSFNTGISHHTQPVLKICDAKNLVYCLSCNVCGLQYVGSTVTALRFRMNNHKSCIRNTDPQQGECFELYRHLREHGSGFKCQILEQTSGSGCLRERETRWIWRMGSIHPNGLNTSDGFNCQLKKSRR